MGGGGLEFEIFREAMSLSFFRYNSVLPLRTLGSGGKFEACVKTDRYSCLFGGTACCRAGRWTVGAHSRFVQRAH